MYESLLTVPGWLAELDRMQRDVQQAFGTLGLPNSIRAVAQGAFPQINIGATPQEIVVYAFAPGLDPARIDVTLDRGVLTVSGHRLDTLPGQDAKRSVYAAERFSGAFRRAISLSEDADPARVSAQYRDGVLRISVARRESAQPKRVEIQ